MLVQGSARKRTLGAPSPSRAPLLLRAVPHGDSDTTTDSPPFLKPGLPSPPSSPRRASPRVPFGRSAEGRSVVGLPGGAGSSLHPRPHCACAQPWLPGQARKLVSGVSSALAPPPSPPPHCSPLSACAPVSRTTRVPQSHNGCHLWAKPGRTVHLLLQRPFRLSSGKPVLILAESALPGGPLR